MTETNGSKHSRFEDDSTFSSRVIKTAEEAKAEEEAVKEAQADHDAEK